ncbi:MAG: hypothetical protein ACREVN_10290 [Gammaproteobacteria bacterium]
MLNRLGLTAGIAAIVVVAGCAAEQASRPAEPEAEAAYARPRPGLRAPTGIQQSALAKLGNASEKKMIRLEAEPSSIDLADIPRTPRTQADDDLPVRGGDRIESKFTDAEVEAAQETAANQPVSPGIQNIDGSEKPVGPKPKLRSRFDSLHAGECCTGTGFSATVPPDPDMAAGPDHLIVVVNTAFEVYDWDGNSLTGPIQFATFFDPTRGGTDPGAGTPTPGCTAFSFQFGAQRSEVFDPDVVYDEDNDRFVIGIDGGGVSYCVAATATSDPTGAWNRYGFTTPPGEFFDFPHMGVGADAIFVGSNQFAPVGGGGLAFAGGQVFAMDKFAMYDGDLLTVVTRRLSDPGSPSGDKFDGTPQPMQLHGLPFPPSGSEHYIMGEFFDGKSHAVYSWEDPFGANDFEHEGDVDLAAGAGVPCENFSCFPVPWTQKGSPEILAANDYRGQETEWRDGLLWTTQTVSCNPDKGVRDCVRWAQIDPTEVQPGTLNMDGSLTSTTDGVIQAGVFGSSNYFRTFPSIAVNSCNDMAVGYSRGSEKEFPSVFVAGRRASDSLGTIGGESKLHDGEEPYSSFQNNGGVAPQRWGDYSGMTIAPDGTTFWYVGEYARENTPNQFANWGNFVGSFEIQGCN